MTNLDARPDRLVDHLETIAARQDRATLARLRRSLHPEHALDGLPVVLPYVPHEGPAEDDALLLAGLFALHPESGPISLATALGVAARTSDSVELRFRALLSAGRPDLPTHLRHAVMLVATEGLSLDWRDLHTAIRFWDHPADRARRRWARDFWTPSDPDEPNSDPA